MSTGTGGKGDPNRLIYEKSPYLLKHAYNPVDWHPWGEEAFGLAREQGKPVFLSVGYSTCHWCNVMEEESFADPEVAGLMNEAFVCIKVDREERPDVDNIYMTACIMLTGTGGWPLTVVMTPERMPFYAATYLPKHSRFGKVGMVELIPRIREIWTKRRGEVLESADKIARSLEEHAAHVPGKAPGRMVLHSAFKELLQSFDGEHGGFGEAPKFPAAHNLLFLLRYGKLMGQQKAVDMAVKTLKNMHMGGMYDHLGHGFHRYSTDAQWRVPHFEKMLYDQAMLALAYCEAYHVTGEGALEEAARGVFSYVLGDMVSAQGGFLSADSADSEGQEGKFYLWEYSDIKGLLSDEEFRVIDELFGLSDDGNFIDQLTQEKPGTNILSMTGTYGEVAGRLGMKMAKFTEVLASARHKLYEARSARVHPDRDDKVLTDWNGLMIAALSTGYRVFGESSYLEAARRAADFVLTTLRKSDGRLLHRFRDGEAAIEGKADDYAFFIWGLIEFYEAGFEPRYLRAAVELNGVFIEDFWDARDGGFYFIPKGVEEHIVRKKEVNDAAIPSSNSVAMLNLLRLGRLTSQVGLLESADKLSRAFAESVRLAPTAHSMFLSAVVFVEEKTHEIVVVGRPGADDTRAMLRAVHGAYLPSAVYLLKPVGEGGPEVESLAPFTRELSSMDEKATAYVCSDFKCKLPTTDPKEVLSLLGIK